MELEAYLADSLSVVNTPDGHLSAKVIPSSISDMLLNTNKKK